jgi:8-oxo-dGTP pyrophosphatase MutT (NUDIX family)
MAKVGHYLMMQWQRLFDARSPRLQVAALPWRRASKGVEIMLVTSRGSGRWILPKGWPEAGEALWDAAAREADEEAGISGIVSPQELGAYRYEKSKGSEGASAFEVKVYPLEVQTVAKTWREHGQRHRQWFPVADAAAKVREPDLAALIADFGRRSGQRKAA